jgi:hypothetical protein
MNRKTYDLIEAYAILVKDKTGKVEVHNQAGGSDRAMVASQTNDTAVARLSALPANAAIPPRLTRPRAGRPVACRRRT